MNFLKCWLMSIGFLAGITLFAIGLRLLMCELGSWYGVTAGFLLVSLLIGSLIYDAKHGKL